MESIVIVLLCECSYCRCPLFQWLLAELALVALSYPPTNGIVPIEPPRLDTTLVQRLHPKVPSHCGSLLYETRGVLTQTLEAAMQWIIQPQERTSHHHDIFEQAQSKQPFQQVIYLFGVTAILLIALQHGNPDLFSGIRQGRDWGFGTLNTLLPRRNIIAKFILSLCFQLGSVFQSSTDRIRCTGRVLKKPLWERYRSN